MTVHQHIIAAGWTAIESRVLEQHLYADLAAAVAQPHTPENLNRIARIQLAIACGAATEANAAHLRTVTKFVEATN